MIVETFTERLRACFCKNGHEALELLKAANLTCLFSKEMPGMTVIELLERSRQFHRKFVVSYNCRAIVR
jgi:CheY-like chemotaxis protein